MKKLYYKIELRLGRTYIDHKGNLQKDFFYYSDGYIIITGEKFEGHLTDDYIKGYLTETDITLKLQRKEKTDLL